MDLNMKMIHLDTLPIWELAERSPRLICVGRHTTAEITKGFVGDVEDIVFLTIYHRFPRSQWWNVYKWTAEVWPNRVTFPADLPSSLMVRVINKIVGREVVRVSRAAGCTQCHVHHGEWVETEVGLHCTLCGWIAGTVPEGHVQVGDRFWVGDSRVVVHPDTIVRVLAAHNQVTALCAPSPELWAWNSELPKEPLPLKQVPEAVSGYAYIQVQVVALPERFDPLPYR
jgi:hypothetical protein